MADTTSQRICPVCGHLTEDNFCPKEGASTVVARGFAKHPRNYEVGDLVGQRYRIQGAVGSGGYAAVYAAEHTGTGQQVAVKLMAFDPTEEGGKLAVRRFFREARTMAGLEHRNTVRVFDAGQDDDGAVYIAMELLHGESLEELLKRVLRSGEALTVEATLDIMIPVLASLQEAHAAQLVHRDLKPANIFLVRGEDGHTIPKVLDYGIARTAESSLTVGGTIPGTPPFMSPEQCRGEALDGRSDLYSLAVLLFLCVVGRLPFHDANVLHLMRMHAFDPPPNPRGMTDRPLPDGLVDILRRALAKQPEARPADAAAMAAELQEIRDGTWLPAGFDGDTEASAMVIDADGATQQRLFAVDPGAVFAEASADPVSRAANSASILGLDTESYPSTLVVEAASVAEMPALQAAPARASPAQASPVQASPIQASPIQASPIQASPVQQRAAQSEAAQPAGQATMEPTPSARTLRSPLFVLGLAVLILGGLAVGLWLGRGSTAQAPATVQPPSVRPSSQRPVVTEARARAKIALKLAEKAEDPVKKLDYAREALHLDPSYEAAAVWVKRLEVAGTDAGSGGGQVPTAVVPAVVVPAVVVSAVVESDSRRPPTEAVAKPTRTATPNRADPSRKKRVPQPGMAPALMD